MPAVSEKQRRAMWAAAKGHSRLGIPQSVGEEYVKNDAITVAPELGDLNDFETAEAIRDGDLPSPMVYNDAEGEPAFWLFDLRITGTGMAWRERIAEWAHRDPEEWATPEFVQRCNGLAVIMEHPPTPGLNTEEFRERSIGSIILPYLKGDEVWGVAKIFDGDAALMMQTTHRSTSPGVTPPKGSKAMSLESGAQVLDEGLPLVLDHLAVCEVGVWDKGGDPEGVRLDSALIGKGEVVADKTREQELEEQLADAKSKLDAAEAERDSHKGRADAAEAESGMQKKRADEAEEREEERKREDAARLDAKRKDSRKKHHDAKKHDGEFMDCARCDSEAEEIEKEEKAEEEAGGGKDAKHKKDAAPEHEPEAGRGTEDIKDSAKIANMQQQIDQLTRANRPLTIEERDQLSVAYHRYDGLFQMLMDASPQPTPGETPIAFRKRAANALRKYTTSFKNYVFHDSQQLKDFELVETAIFDEAMAYAKNPPADEIAGQVREIKDSTTLPGKVITRFVGDQHAVWEAFKSPQRFLQRVVKRQPHGAAF